jgi:predicted nucleic acid-binding protein
VLSRPVAERAAAFESTCAEQSDEVDERALDILIAATAIVHELTLVTRKHPRLRRHSRAPTLPAT